MSDDSDPFHMPLNELGLLSHLAAKTKLAFEEIARRLDLHRERLDALEREREQPTSCGVSLDGFFDMELEHHRARITRLIERTKRTPVSQSRRHMLDALFFLLAVAHQPVKGGVVDIGGTSPNDLWPLLSEAWGLIANVADGDWDRADVSSEWKEAAERWRDLYLEARRAWREDRHECRACHIEAEIGTEEKPHPVPPRFHTCRPRLR